MVKSCPPRRPAMLTPAKAESIVGDENPATSSGLAHSSAWALMGVGDEDFDREATLRLRALVRDRGVDQVAHLWSHSPESLCRVLCGDSIFYLSGMNASRASLMSDTWTGRTPILFRDWNTLLTCRSWRT